MKTFIAETHSCLAAHWSWPDLKHMLCGRGKWDESTWVGDQTDIFQDSGP